MSSPLTAGEVDELRGATPGAAEVVHLNHAGASLPSRSVLDTQLGHLELEARIGGYEAADERRPHDDAVYASIAGLIGAHSHEIARVEHATAAWNAAFWSVPVGPGQAIVTAAAAYGANHVAFLRAAERRRARIVVIDDDEHGQLDVAELARVVEHDDVALIAVTHVPTNGGLVNPAPAVGRVANAAGVPFLLDACQSVGQLALDVAEIGCDLLSGTGRKYLRGPRGSGFLYASDRVIDRLVPDHPDHHGSSLVGADRYELRPDARRFEHWEYNHAAWLALGAAVDEAAAIGIERIEATVTRQADRLREALDEAGFEVCDKGERRCGIVSATADGLYPTAVKHELRRRAINISVSTPDSTRFDADRRQLPDLLRLSVHYLTTDTELEQAVAALAEATGST